MLILFMKVKNLMVAITMAPGLQIHQINFQKHTFLWQVGKVVMLVICIQIQIMCPSIFDQTCSKCSWEKKVNLVFLTLYTQGLKETFQNGSLKHWSNKVISKRIRRRKYTKSLVNTNWFYTNFQKIPIAHLTRTKKQKFLH